MLGALVAAAAAITLLLAPPGQAADPPSPSPTTVVQQGDTLWSIAERHAPRRDRFATVNEIRLLNGIDGYEIQAGQRLVLPKAG